MKTRRKQPGFTIIELRVVISIVSIIIALVLPALALTQERAHYVRWQGFSHQLRVDPDLIAYYNFEHETHGNLLYNAAVGDVAIRYDSDSFHGDIDFPDWTQSGRWTNKPALSFVPALYTRGVRVEPKIGTTSTDRITVIGWIRFFGPPTGSDVIVSKWNSGDDQRSWCLDFHGDDLCWRTSGDGTAGGEVELKADIAAYYGMWVHFAATFDGSEVKLYVNGARRDQDSQTGLLDSDQPIYIGGAGSSGAAGRLNGIIDELAVFSRPLSRTEIRQHFQMGYPSSNASPPGADDDDQVGNGGGGDDDDDDDDDHDDDDDD